MIILCKNCQAKIKVADSAFDRGIPTVICPKCNKQFKPDVTAGARAEGSVSTEDTRLMPDNTEVGWLVVHDEKTKQQTLPLKPGKQSIGRISSIAGKKADLMIETSDDYMSRQHFTICVENKSSGERRYCLSDNSSKNRTLLNKKQVKKEDEYILRDGDVIQAGVTNIVFKTDRHVKNKKEATLAVTGQPPIKTEIVFDN